MRHQPIVRGMLHIHRGMSISHCRPRRHHTHHTHTGSGNLKAPKKNDSDVGGGITAPKKRKLKPLTYNF